MAETERVDGEGTGGRAQDGAGYGQGGPAPVAAAPDTGRMAVPVAALARGGMKAAARRGREGMGPATYGTVFWLALPTLIENLLLVAIATTDTVVAGHMSESATVNAAASAAVGTITYLQWLMGILTSAFTAGCIAVVARSIGAKRIRVANRVAGTVLTAAFLMGLVLAVLVEVFAPQIVWASQLEGQAAVFGVQYLRIMAITICLQTVGQIGMASLRGAGDMVRPMLITGTVAAINAVLVPALAFGWFGLPAWGIRGNATGTMLAFLISGVGVTVVLLSGRAPLRLRWRHFRLVPHVLWRVAKIGLPSWMEGLLLWVGQFLIVVFVINRNDAALGVVGGTMSAHSTVLRIESFAFLPGFGFGMACSALVGQYLGARMPEEAKRATAMANRLAFGLMTLLALPMVVMPGVLLGWMVDSPPVVRVGIWPMVIAGLAQPGFAVAIIKGSALRGAGETVWPMISTIVGMFLVRFPPVLFLAMVVFPRMGHPAWGLVAVWIGIFVDLNFRAVFNWIVFVRGKWVGVEV